MSKYPKLDPNTKRLAYGVREAAAMYSVGESFIRYSITEKRLRAKRVGRRVLLMADDLEAFFRSMKDWDKTKRRTLAPEHMAALQEARKNYRKEAKDEYVSPDCA